MAEHKSWQEIVAAWPKPERKTTTSPKTLELRQTKAYTSHGRPTQRYLAQLVAALPAKPEKVWVKNRISRLNLNGDRAKRLGLGRANLRAFVRQQAATEERVFTPKPEFRPIPWRNVAYAFRRFNPDATAIGGEAINVREVA